MTPCLPTRFCTCAVRHRRKNREQSSTLTQYSVQCLAKQLNGKALNYECVPVLYDHAVYNQAECVVRGCDVVLRYLT